MNKNSALPMLALCAILLLLSAACRTPSGESTPEPITPPAAPILAAWQPREFTVTGVPDPETQIPPPDIPAGRYIYERDRIFDGFIYPALNADGSTIYEVDAPLRTTLAERQDYNQGTYYSFSVGLFTQGFSWLKIAWRDDTGQEYLLEEMDSCDPETREQELAYMKAMSARWTGRETHAAFNLILEELLNDGQPIYWLTCDRIGDEWILGESTVSDANGLSGVNYQVAIMLPAELLAGEGGQLEVHALNVGGESGPLIIPIQESQPRMAVVGDSVAWGQGLTEAQKDWRQVADMIDDLNGADLEIDLLAHSGATLGSQRHLRDPAAVSAAQVWPEIPLEWSWSQDPLTPLEYGCNGDQRARYGGEVPRIWPLIACQIVDMSRRFIDSRSGDPLAVPTTFAKDTSNTSLWATEPGAGGAGIETHRYIGPGQWFDYGPRYDYVWFTGCINDVGPRRIHLGHQSDGDTLQDLSGAISAYCDLEEYLENTRFYLPNAAVVVGGYHRTVSEETDLPAPPVMTLLSNTLLTGPSVADVSGFLDNNSAERAGLFQERSDQLLANSVNLANTTAPVGGIGELVFVSRLSDAGFDLNHAMYANAPWVFGIGADQRAEDDMRQERLADCGLWGSDNDATTFNLVFCQYASAFHPNILGAAAMADAAVARLTDLGLETVVGSSLNLDR